MWIQSLCVLSDVLILNQFLRDDGKIIEREVTGLCRRQHKRMDKLIKMAQKAGLFPNKDYYQKEREDPDKPWLKLNSYWDEKTIDIQWLTNERKNRIKSWLQ